MADGQPTSALDDSPLSRAGSLPQGCIPHRSFASSGRAGLAGKAVLFETSHLAPAATLDQQTG
ncbi:hypothetical protein CUN61_01425 [Pseudomonas arsenicoxydans]|uniref:Uncharacterized protein n=1 Tax=Pseudomonas arsenicoxydans TaxID=702115 RepID=A0A4P6FVH8_9PSED|nr:hypothetical protein CUN61_01425 [Pseudomonas arsenicoxydans]